MCLNLFVKYSDYERKHFQGGMIFFSFFASVCSVAFREVQSVPVTLGQFRVLVPVVRSSVVTLGNTESSVSFNSGSHLC